MGGRGVAAVHGRQGGHHVGAVDEEAWAISFVQLGKAELVRDWLRSGLGVVGLLV